PFYRNHLMRLSARASHLSRQKNILTVAEHPPEGIAGKGSWGSLLPRHDHPSVYPSGKRHPDAFVRTKISGEIPRKDFLDFLIVRFRLQMRLLFPLPGLEVCVFPL